MRPLIAIILCVVAAVSGSRGRARYNKRKCEPVNIELCKDVGYNMTYMPNQYNHKQQSDAGYIINQYAPLVKINCSPLLKHLICSLYLPMCDAKYHKDIVPCRSFCEDVRDSCVHILKLHNLPWPKDLQCSNFPTREENKICMKPESDIKPSRKPRPTVAISSTKAAVGCGCNCKHPFVRSNATSENDILPPCVLKCGQYFFSKNQNTFVTFWLGLWSIIAFVATAFTLITFLLSRREFSYIERPIIFMAGCYLMVAFGYLLRLFYGYEAIACNGGLMRYSATGPARCTAVFMLNYFFTNVGWIWWVVLSMNWFLSTGLRWSDEAISSYSQYFHFIAWLVPIVQTMAILAMAAIDSDPVSGMCSVGNHDNNTLTIFVIAPLLIYVTLSFSFFVAGVIAKFQVARHVIDRVNTHMMKHTCQLISRIGVFTFVTFVPVACLLGCYFYEHNQRELWEKSTNCECMAEKREPHFYVFLLKYLMSLAPGVAIGFWVVNARTWEVWRNFTKRSCFKSYNATSSGGSATKENNNLLHEQKCFNTAVSL